MKRLITHLTIVLITFNVALSQKDQFNFPIKKGEPKKANFELSTKGISPFTATLLTDLKIREAKSKSDITLDTALIKKYGLINQNGVLYTNAFLIINETFQPSELSKYGFKQGSHQGKYATGLIPVNNIQQIQNDTIVKYIQIGEPVKPQLDAARSATWVDWVHQGYQLPQSYDGSGVVIGIIDGGFDYSHPNFFDATGTNNYRIKRVWEQNATTGTPPSGFSYGRELTTQSSIQNAQTDNSAGSHGTHVAGIAAGAGGGGSTTYQGVALQSDIVLVSYKYTPLNVEIADGIAYIMNYATSVGKPCVINMSLGQHIGPHDGNSLFDQYCDGIVGQGRLLVGSAGNQGEEPLFIGKSFTSFDSIMYSFVEFPTSSLGTDGSGTIDIWGNPNQIFWVAVNIYNTDDDHFEDWTPYIPANSNSTYNYTLEDDDPLFTDDCIVAIGSEINPLNNKPRIFINIDNTDQDDDYRWVMVEIIAYNAQTKMWGGPTGGNVEFTNNGYGYPILDGSTNSTMGEIGGTGNNIITVGAYTSKNSWNALNGSNQSVSATVGAIASFSSKGPTADGRTKPDIAAPGNVIVSSVNRFDSNYPNTSDEVVSGVTNGVNNWYFAKMQGTSMASPMVTGILALWLEAYPFLTPSQAKTIIKDNAWTDSYTGVIPASGSNVWGWGKIDAHEGLKDLLTKIPPTPVINVSGNTTICQGQSVTLSAPNGYAAYEWSNNETTQSITVSTAGNYSVHVMDNQGYISMWSNPIQITINSQPATPSINATSTSICQGQSTTLSVSSPCTGCTYAWSSGQSGTSIQVTSAASYSVTATNSCGTATSNSINIVVNQQPTTPNVNVNPSNVFCQGESATLTILNPCSGCNYSWSSGQTGTSIQVTSTSNYSVTATNSCGNTSSSPMSVVVNPQPTTPLLNVSPSNSVCQGETITLTVNNPCSGCSYTWSPGNQAGTSIQVTSSNNYSANASNNCGQVASNSVNVTVNSLPPTPTISVNGNELTSSAAVGNQWYFNGSIISGATQQTYIAQQAGDYHVVVTDANNCSSQSSVLSFVPTGIDNVDDPLISIYPNPTTGELNITFSGNYEKPTIKVYDMVGQLVFSQQYQGNEQNQTIDLSGFSDGVYNLRVETNGHWVNHKILLLK